MTNTSNVAIILLCSLAVAMAIMPEGTRSYTVMDVVTKFDFGTENPYRLFNEWVNSFFFSDATYDSLIEKFGEHGGYYMATYLRDLICGNILYWVTAGVWHFAVYTVLGTSLFKTQRRAMPGWPIMREQMALCEASLFLYATVPLILEVLVENGITRSFFYISDVGVPTYLGLLVLYMFFVEHGVYWAHRTLHTNKFLYKYVHGLHHKYNKWDTLTPWCSIAFNPLDGMIQASPYIIVSLVIPVHFVTQLMLIFLTGIWATNIHDAIPVNSEPMMGAGYHTIHHTHYMYNFGQYLTLCDWTYGTLRAPLATDIPRLSKDE